MLSVHVSIRTKPSNDQPLLLFLALAAVTSTLSTDHSPISFTYDPFINEVTIRCSDEAIGTSNTSVFDNFLSAKFN
jgi:hypothetical protein